MRKDLWVLLIGLALPACASTAGTAEGAADPAPEPVEAAAPLDASQLPKGTLLETRLQDTLRAATARVGDRFAVSVTTELIAQNGQVVIPAGTVITGLVTGRDDTDHDGDPAYLRLNFVRLTLEEANHPFAAEIVNTNLQVQPPAGLEEAAKDAAAGALGAIISGDVRAALEAAELGAGAGTVIGLGTDADRALLPAGTILRLRTSAAIELRR